MHYDVRITGLVDRKNGAAVRLILFRDIARRKEVERQQDILMADLNKKILSLRSYIAWH
jgi:hypothetical protein